MPVDPPRRESTGDPDPTGHPANPLRSHRVATWFAAVLVALTLLAGCGGSSTPPGLAVDLVDDHFELSIAHSSDDLARGHDIQIRPVSLIEGVPEPERDWEDIAPGDDRVRIGGLTDHTHYQFRYRTHPEDGTPGSWSEPVTRLFVQTSLPVVRLDTDDRAAITGKKRPARDGTFTLSDPEDPAQTVPIPAQIRGRGNTTWSHVPGKKSYQVNFTDQVSPLGLPAADKFVLLANYFDRSQLRTWIAMELSKATDLAWTPQFRWVEVILNGDYMGVYQLGEKVDVGPTKVDLEVPGKTVTGGEQITGDYLLQMGEVTDVDADENTDTRDKQAWTTARGVPLSIDRPKADKSNTEQFDYIRGYIAEFETALFSDRWTDPEVGYAHYLDLDSFIDYWIVQELTVNIDAYINSTYLYKKRDDPKIYFGPLWDFDVSMGSSYGYLEATAEGWHTIHPGLAPNNKYRPWIMRLFSDPEFVERVDARWGQLVPAFEQVAASIPLAAASIDQARAGDLVRWQDAEETRFHHRYGDVLPEDEPDFLHHWLTDRIAWMTVELQRLVDGGDIGDRLGIREQRGPTPTAPTAPTSMDGSR